VKRRSARPWFHENFQSLSCKLGAKAGVLRFREVTRNVQKRLGLKTERGSKKDFFFALCGDSKGISQEGEGTPD